MRIFGSASRGQDTTDSALDLLVRFDDDASLLDLVGLATYEQDLSFKVIADGGPADVKAGPEISYVRLWPGPIMSVPDTTPEFPLSTKSAFRALSARYPEGRVNELRQPSTGLFEVFVMVTEASNSNHDASSAVATAVHEIPGSGSWVGDAVGSGSGSDVGSGSGSDVGSEVGEGEGSGGVVGSGSGRGDSPGWVARGGECSSDGGSSGEGESAPGGPDPPDPPEPSAPPGSSESGASGSGLAPAVAAVVGDSDGAPSGGLASSTASGADWSGVGTKVT